MLCRQSHIVRMPSPYSSHCISEWKDSGLEPYVVNSTTGAISASGARYTLPVSDRTLRLRENQKWIETGRNLCGSHFVALVYGVNAQLSQVSLLPGHHRRWPAGMRSRSRHSSAGAGAGARAVGTLWNRSRLKNFRLRLRKREKKS